MKKCDECKNWKPLGDAKTWGDCILLKEHPEGDYVNMYTDYVLKIDDYPKIHFETAWNFGCILWEEKI